MKQRTLGEMVENAKKATSEAVDQFSGVVHAEVATEGQNTVVDAARPTQRGTALLRALEVINGERQDVYGSPEDSFALIAEYWSVYWNSAKRKRDCFVSEDVALMMTLFKIAREANQRKADNIIDAAGYLGIYSDFHI